MTLLHNVYDYKNDILISACGPSVIILSSFTIIIIICSHKIIIMLSLINFSIRKIIIII